MEHLHTLINGIDSVKEHLTDNEYLELMKAIGKLSEMINDDTKSVSELNSVSDDDEEPDEEPEEDEEEPEDDINIIDIDLLLKIIDENELVFRTYMTKKNLSEDFINSKFNIINKNAYNYLYNKTCNCKEDYELCVDSDILNCKNYQKFILKFPLIHIVTRDCSHCVEVVCNEINKYNLFSFDGTINKLNEIQSELFGKYSGTLMNMLNNVTSVNKILLFMNIFSYIFENGHLLIENEKFKDCCSNKLLTEGTNDVFNQHFPYWSNLLNINSNIINIMINNLIELN